MADSTYSLPQSANSEERKVAAAAFPTTFLG
jgi:hypothetical protein